MPLSGRDSTSLSTFSSLSYVRETFFPPDNSATSRWLYGTFFLSGRVKSFFQGGYGFPFGPPFPRRRPTRVSISAFYRPSPPRPVIYESLLRRCDFFRTGNITVLSRPRLCEQAQPLTIFFHLYLFSPLWFVPSHISDFDSFCRSSRAFIFENILFFFLVLSAFC